MSTSDWGDIKNWNVSLTKFREHFQSAERKEGVSHRPLEVDPVKLYALFKTLPPHRPMGFYTFLLQGPPMGALVWWDFVIECEIGFIHVWRTSQTLEAFALVNEATFDLHTFFTSNFKRYDKEIKDVVGKLEEVSVYLNHYDSYRMSVNYLWDEIRQLNLTPPSVTNAHYAKDHAEIAAIGQALSEFRDRSLKFHVLGKSLLLNASFMIDSFINLLIRVGAKRDLLENKSVLEMHLGSRFSDRLKHLKYYSAILREPVDLNHAVVQAALELMTIRNKYVHYDESSAHNRIGTVHFDDMFPVFPAQGHIDLIQKLVLTYHNPPFDKVKKAYDTATAFVGYMESLIHPDAKKGVLMIMGQSPMAYNETKRMYSYVFSPGSVSFFLPPKPEDGANALGTAADTPQAGNPAEE